MSSVHVALCKCSGRAETGMTIAAPDAVPLASETLTAGASSTASTIAAPAAEGVFWMVEAIDGDIWFAFGSTPDASADPRWFCPIGQSRAVHATAGHKVAVKAK